MATKPKTLADETTTDPVPEPKTDPVSPPVESVPVETMDDLGITANDPYPTGSPPDPEDQFEAAHGFRRAPPEA